MEINILVIDDEYDKRALDDLKEELFYEVNKSSSISQNVNLEYVNPMKYINLSLEEGRYDELFKYLDESFLNKKLDMLLCDFNLNATHKHISFHIINHVRTRNKACSIILFSGSPLKELIRINNNDLAKKISEYINEDSANSNVPQLEKKLEELRKEEEPAEELMEMAVKSNITAIVSRTKYEQRAIEIINNPSIYLWLENELLKNGELIFNDGNEKLNGIKLDEIARHIREQTDEGVYFAKEILQMSIANLIKLNS